MTDGRWRLAIFALGFVAGGVFGFWLYGFWQHDLAGTGAGEPPLFDLYVPVLVIVLALGVLFIGRR